MKKRIVTISLALAILTVPTLLAVAALPDAGSGAPAPTRTVAHAHPEEEELAVAAREDAAPDAASAPGGEASNDTTHRRLLQLRIFGEDGTLLGSSWANETGEVEHLDPEAPPGPYAWGTRAELTRPEPMWEPLVDFLHMAPVNATLRIENYTFGDHKTGEFEVPRHHDLPRQATLTRAQADEVLQKGLAVGDLVHFIGLIPMEIVSADAAHVTYRFAFNESVAYDVQRTQGLRIVGSLLPDGETVRFSLEAPEGGFTAHANCSLPSMMLKAGYYVVREETDDALLLDRYNTHAEHALQHRTVAIEVTFQDGAEPGERVHDGHAH